jgi:hypothetical protein
MEKQFEVIRSHDELGGYFEHPTSTQFRSLHEAIKFLAAHNSLRIDGGTTSFLRRIEDGAELVPWGPKDSLRAASAANPCQLAWATPDGRLELINMCIRWGTAKVAWPSREN